VSNASEPSNDRVVSFDDEPLILVDADDNVLGHDSKAACHDGEGMLHRAFSIFLFNGAGQVLLQRRSEQKRLWPLYWSNSCCSHPRRGEGDLEAAERRIHEELAVSPPLTFLFRFEYHARYQQVGAEHELCSTYAALSDERIAVNTNEIADWEFVTPEELDRRLDAEPQRCTPWLKLEWPRIRSDHWKAVEALRGKKAR